MRSARSVRARRSWGLESRDASWSTSPHRGRRCRDVYKLTDRERQVLDLIANGAGEPGHRHAPGDRAKTVRNHVSNIFSKLQVVDRAQAIIAHAAGLGVREGDS